MSTFFPRIEGVDDNNKSLEVYRQGTLLLKSSVPVNLPSDATQTPRKKTSAARLRDARKKAKENGFDRTVRVENTETETSLLKNILFDKDDVRKHVEPVKQISIPTAMPEAKLEDLKLTPDLGNASHDDKPELPAFMAQSSSGSERSSGAHEPQLKSQPQHQESSGPKDTTTAILEQNFVPPPPPPPPGGDNGPDENWEPALPEDKQLSDALQSLRFETDISNCVVPLLEAIGWRGHPRHVAEAIPHFLDNLDITAFRNIFANLRYESWPVDVELRKIDTRLLPCLFLPKDGDAMIILSIENGTANVFNGATKSYQAIPMTKMLGKAYIFKQMEEDLLKTLKAKLGWFRAVGERFRGLIYQTLVLTFLLNLLALATPMFVMAVYDKVVATGNMETLAYFAIGVSLAIGCDMILRAIRSRVLAFVGARLDNIVGNAVFQKILFLPASLTEKSTVGSQVARIKDFESIREFFTGQLALTFIELPFSFIFIIAIAILGGPVALVPLVMMALFAILSFVVSPLIQQSVSRAARGASRRQELVVETLGVMRSVKASGGEDKWLERFREDSARSALNSFYTSQYGSVVQTLSSMLMTISGLATIAFGVYRVLDGNMTMGALVACMILVWRVLGPVQATFVSLSRMTSVKSSIGQINTLMNLKAERDPDKVVNPLKRFSGKVSFTRVSMRYTADTDPALVGVSFDVEPGEVVAIVGGNGSGKSTLLKLLAGMYIQQAGSVRVDDQDLRQLDLIELRHAISYVPQVIQFFYGTIAQNMRLTHPTASDEDLRWAAQKAGILDQVEALEQGSGKWKRSGFDVRIGDTASTQMTTSLLQGLNLARGYLKLAPIMIFDEPGNGLDYEGDQAFMAQVSKMRGNTTVFIVTHRPSHLKIADKILWMDSANVRAFGPAEQVRPQLPKNFV